MTRTHTHNFQTCHQKKINAIRRKIVGNTGMMTRQTHHRVTILIRRTTVITDANKLRGGAVRKGIRLNYANV